MAKMNRFNFQQVKANLKITKRELPIKLSAQAENHFAEAFDKGGLDENKWKEVNRRIDGTKEFKYKPKGISLSAHQSNPILVGKGTLRRKVARSAVERKFDRIRLVVDLPYAAIHNEGGESSIGAHSRSKFFTTHTKTYQGLKMNKKGQYKESYSRRKIEIRGEDIQVGAHTRRVPARPFMKQTSTLTSMQTSLIREYMDKIWNT
jgi:phage gpG-like protein